MKCPHCMVVLVLVAVLAVLAALLLPTVKQDKAGEPAAVEPQETTAQDKAEEAAPGNPKKTLAQDNPARRLTCTNNLKQIGLSIQMYLIDHDDCCPPDLQALRDSSYLTDTSVYLCPSAARKPGADSAFATSYVYLGAGLRQDNDGDTPLAMDDPRNHNDYVNILFKDGHVQGFKLPHEMTSCVEVLRLLFPDLDKSPQGRIVLKNAEKADAGAPRF